MIRVEFLFSRYNAIFIESDKFLHEMLIFFSLNLSRAHAIISRIIHFHPSAGIFFKRFNAPRLRTHIYTRAYIKSTLLQLIIEIRERTTTRAPRKVAPDADVV